MTERYHAIVNVTKLGVYGRIPAALTRRYLLRYRMVPSEARAGTIPDNQTAGHEVVLD
jgi:hypothetical protein